MATDLEEQLKACEQEKLIIIIVVAVLFAVIACIIIAILAVYFLIKHQNPNDQNFKSKNEHSLANSLNVKIGEKSASPITAVKTRSEPTFIPRHTNFGHSAASSLMVDQSIKIDSDGRFTQILRSHRQHAQNPSLAIEELQNFNSLTINSHMIHSDLILREMIANRDAAPIGNITPIPIMIKKNGNRHIAYTYTLTANDALHKNTTDIKNRTQETHSYHIPNENESNKLALSLMHPQQIFPEDGLVPYLRMPNVKHLDKKETGMTAMENFLVNPSYDDMPEGDVKNDHPYIDTFEEEPDLPKTTVERIRSNSDHLANTGYSNGRNLSRILPNEINFQAEIGRGSSALVYKGRWKDMDVAIKRFKAESVDLKKVKKFLSVLNQNREIYKHENVIKLYAYAYDKNNPFTFVTEYIAGGSVKKHISTDSPTSLSISILQRIELSLQAARGIQHLHKHNFLHRDIACRNLMMEVMVKDGYSYKTEGSNKNKKNIIIEIEKGDNIILSVPRVVVVDFGLSALLGEDAYTRFANIQALKWRAPEVIENDRYSLESDVYAFGITLWEIMTGQEPYVDVNPIDVSIQVLVHDKRPQSFAFVPTKIQKLMKECWAKKREKRPKFDEIVKRLEGFIIDEHQRRKKEEQHHMYL